jgi:arginyl-tRNA synthetase
MDVSAPWRLISGALELVVLRHEPHHLAALLHDSAMSFSDFYETCDVLGTDGESRVSRLSLTELAARTLACGLDLLGIAAADRM